MTGPLFHYHVTLECGHKTAFDVNKNLIAIAVEHMGEPQVEIPCKECNSLFKNSTSLILVGRDIRVCECGKGMSL